MVTTALVDDKIDAGKELLHRLENEAFPLAGAFWFYFSEPEKWRLMIASKLVDSEGPRAVYARIDDLIRSTRDMRLSLDDISVASPRDSLVRTLRDGIRNGTLVPGVQLTRSVVGGVYIDDAYVYGID